MPEIKDRASLGVTKQISALVAQALGDDEAALAAKLQIQRDLEAEADALPCSVRKDVDKLQVRADRVVSLKGSDGCKTSLSLPQARICPLGYLMDCLHAQVVRSLRAWTLLQALACEPELQT